MMRKGRVKRASGRDTIGQFGDLAVWYGGSYYLTYHRWAERRQVEACYPQFQEFLSLKLRYDPAVTFQSNWYRYYREMFSA